jgi:hypothetical protein
VDSQAFIIAIIDLFCEERQLNKRHLRNISNPPYRGLPFSGVRLEPRPNLAAHPGTGGGDWGWPEQGCFVLRADTSD